MYLSRLSIYNFRKFGSTESEKGLLPGVEINFNDHMNVIVGENDSGKTAIVDAIKFLCATRSYDYNRIAVEDFHISPKCNMESCRETEIRIEGIFSGFTEHEAKNFLEWISIEDGAYSLHVKFVAKRNGRKVSYDILAGKNDGNYLDGKARDLLRVTYLKPLRDAENELIPRRGSRISQILDSHEAFEEKDDHHLVTIVSKANQEISNFFSGNSSEAKHDSEIDETIPPGKKLHNDINSYLENFSDKKSPLSSRFSVAETRLKSILESLHLMVIDRDRDSMDISLDHGLGSKNLLFIAAEFLLLQKEEFSGFRLGLIEELEAHLHPQAQLRLIEYLQEETKKSSIQLILTTHSPVLASKIKLEYLIICNQTNTYSLDSESTELEKGDYSFLERFLDSTKANMFFAKGVILVEGDAENLLIPEIGKLIDFPLAQNGVSLVNVRSTAFLRYSRIYLQKNGKPLGIPVSIITDLDVKPDDQDKDIEEEKNKKNAYFSKGDVKTFVSPHWTLEYCLALNTNLRWILLRAILYAKKEENSSKYGAEGTKKRKEIRKNLAQIRNKLSALGNEEIAIKIYKEYLLDKKISKAIVAQWFSHFLHIFTKCNVTRDVIIQSIETDPSIRYLADAIKYAAGNQDGL